MTYENFSTTGDHIKQTRDILHDEWDEDTYGKRPAINVIYEMKVADLDGPQGEDRILIYENSVTEQRVDAPYEFIDRIYSYTFDIRCIRRDFDEGRERITYMRNGTHHILMLKRKTWFGYDSELQIQSSNDLSDKENYIYQHIIQVQITRHCIPLIDNEAIA